MVEARGLGVWMAYMMNLVGMRDHGEVVRITMTDVEGRVVEIAWDTARERWVCDDGAEVPLLLVRLRHECRGGGA